MSYINDALKKAQKEREGLPKGNNPLVLSSAESHRARRKRYWSVAACALAVLIAVVMAAVLSTRDTTKRPAVPGHAAPPVAGRDEPPPPTVARAVPSPATPQAETQPATVPSSPPSRVFPRSPEGQAVGKISKPLPHAGGQAVSAGADAAGRSHRSTVLPDARGSRAAAESGPSAGRAAARFSAPAATNHAGGAKEPAKAAAVGTAAPQGNAPRDVESLYARALEKQKLHRLAEAEAIYREILAWNGGHVRSLNNLGVIYLAQGRKTLAAEAFRQAASLDAAYADPSYNLACLYARQGDLESGLRYLKEAAARDGNVKRWAREDVDLQPLEAMPEYKIFLDKD